MKEDIILTLEKEVAGLKELLNKAEKRAELGKQTYTSYADIKQVEPDYKATSKKTNFLNTQHILWKPFFPPLLASPAHLPHSYDKEIKAQQIKSEENKTRMNEEVIKRLTSDKLQLQQEVAHLNELLQKVEKTVKTGKLLDTIFNQWRNFIYN